jgi:hypothetical protein
MIEFLAQSTDQVGGVLAVGGFDEVIRVLGFCRLLRAGGGHIGRSNFTTSKTGALIKIPRYKEYFMLYENVGEFVVESQRLRFRNLQRIRRQEAGQKNGKAGRCGLSENPWSHLPIREPTKQCFNSVH